MNPRKGERHMSDKEKTAGNRRDFLKLAGATAPAAAVTLAASGTDAAAAAPEDAKGQGLRDTAHTRAYFESARF